VDKALTSIGQITDNDRKALRALNVIRIDATPGRFVAELLIGEGGVVGESAFAALRKLLPDLSPGSPPILRLDHRPSCLRIRVGRRTRPGSTNESYWP
jgi:hypothetical protein